jgi:hypothetical protein
VFESDPVVAQITHLQSLSFDIRFNCHGYSLNTINIVDSKGATHYFLVVQADSANTIITKQYTLQTSAQALADIGSGKKIICVCYDAAGDPVHSYVITSLVLVPGGVNTTKTKCSSKNGILSLVTDATDQSIWGFYSNATIFKGNAATSWSFYTPN